MPGFCSKKLLRPAGRDRGIEFLQNILLTVCAFLSGRCPSENYTLSDKMVVALSNEN